MLQYAGPVKSRPLNYSCSKEMTSNRLGGIRGGTCEVNRRSVLASQPMGHAGLSQFCAKINFSPLIHASRDLSAGVTRVHAKQLFGQTNQQSRTFNRFCIVCMRLYNGQMVFLGHL